MEEGSLSHDFASDSSTLLIAFGGAPPARLGVPAFEFRKATEAMSVKRLLVRDLHMAWYHRGLPGQSTTLSGVAESLTEIVAVHDIDRIVAAGNSAGGYAALVFGTLLGADVVLSFAPQTVLDLDALAALGDHRWDDLLQPLSATGALDRRWTDLRQSLRRFRKPNTSYQVYFDESLAVDRLHAERLSGLPGVSLIRFGTGNHALVREMRRTGALTQVLLDALEPPPATCEAAGARQQEAGS